MNKSHMPIEIVGFPIKNGDFPMNKSIISYINGILQIEFPFPNSCTAALGSGHFMKAWRHLLDKDGAFGEESPKMFNGTRWDI